MLLALVGTTLAYTVEDLATAAQRGLPITVLEAIAADLDPIGEVDVLLLLRSGVPVGIIEGLTLGAHPTPDEIAAADSAGRLRYRPPMREYAALTDRAWDQLIGKAVTVTTQAGEQSGTLVQSPNRADDEFLLVLSASGAFTSVDVRDVRTTRREDGRPIDMMTERDFEEQQYDQKSHDTVGLSTRDEQLGRAGSGLTTAGGVLLGLGAVGLIAGALELTAAENALYASDYAGATTHANAAQAFGYLGWGMTGIGTPMFIAGLIVSGTAQPGSSSNEAAGSFARVWSQRDR